MSRVAIAAEHVIQYGRPDTGGALVIPHKENGPAMLTVDGRVAWFFEGNFHCDRRAARYSLNGQPFFFWHARLGMVYETSCLWYDHSVLIGYSDTPDGPMMSIKQLETKT